MPVPSILLVSGSTRNNSTNTATLRAAASIDPSIASCIFYTGMEGLPQFNPDVEMTALPARVAELRAAIERADAVLISTP